MFEIKLTLVSKNEMLIGVLLEQGEFEVSKDVWVPFTRFRIGMLFIIIDLLRTKITTTS